MKNPNKFLTTRKATIGDSESIAKLIHRSHTISFAPFASAEWVDSRSLAEYQSKWQNMLTGESDSDTATIIAEHPEQGIIGTVRVSTLDSPKFDAQLTGMHVDPTITGQGVGSLLMELAVDFIRKQNFRKVELGVIAANTGARRFYEKHGWTLVEELPNGIEGVPIAIYGFSAQSED